MYVQNQFWIFAVPYGIPSDKRIHVEELQIIVNNIILTEGPESTWLKKKKLIINGNKWSEYALTILCAILMKIGYTMYTEIYNWVRMHIYVYFKASW